MQAMASVIKIIKAKTMRFNETMISINSNERQSQNINHALHSTGSKTSRERLEEVLTTKGTKN